MSYEEKYAEDARRDQEEARQRWLELAIHIEETIADIDASTPAYPVGAMVPPKWWEGMIEVQNLTRKNTRFMDLKPPKVGTDG